MATGPIKQPTHFGSWTEISFSSLPWYAPYDCLVKILSNPNTSANAYDVYRVNNDQTLGIRNNCINGGYEVGSTFMRKGDYLTSAASDNIRNRTIYVLPVVG